MRYLRSSIVVLLAVLAVSTGTPARAALFQFDLAGRVQGTLPGTTLSTDDPFTALFRVDTSAAQFVAGSYTFSNAAFSLLSATLDGYTPFTHGNTRTLNGSGELAIEIISSKFQPPWNGLGNYGRLTFYFPGTMTANDLSTLTLGGLQSSMPWGTVEAQAWSITTLVFDKVDISVVPVPAPLALLGLGLAALGALGRRSKAGPAKR